MGYMGIFLIIRYPKPYSVYLRGTIRASCSRFEVQSFRLRALALGSGDHGGRDFSVSHHFGYNYPLGSPESGLSSFGVYIGVPLLLESAIWAIEDTARKTT